MNASVWTGPALKNTKHDVQQVQPPRGVGRLTLKYRHERSSVVTVGNSRSLEWVYGGYGFAFDGFGDRCHTSDGSRGIWPVLYRPFCHVGWIDFVLLDGVAPKI